MLIFLDKYFPKAELVDFTLEKLVLLIAYLFEEGKSSNTISAYLAALSYHLKFKGKPDITTNFIINNLVNGTKRLAAGPDIRRPITVTVLGHLLQALAHVTKAYYQRIMFEAMFLLAFYAFLRIGEITSRSKTYQNLLMF
jgi:integrase